MIQYRTGNLVESPETVILHGCNARGVMGSGVALAIRKAMPWAYEAYLQSHAAGRLDLGSVIWATSGAKTVANCITQDNFGRDGRKYVDYGAVTACLCEVDVRLPLGVPVAMPRIGCGLGGGSWDEIERIVTRNLIRRDVVVYDLADVPLAKGRYFQ